MVHSPLFIPLRLSPFPDFDMCGSMPGKRDNVCSSSTDHSACVSCLTGCIQQCVPEREDCLINANPSPSQTREPTRVSTPAYKMQRNAWLCHRQNASMNARMHGANGQGVGMRQPRIRMRHTLPDEVWGHENQTFSSFYSAAVQNATYTTRRDNTTSNTTHSSPIDAHFADMLWIVLSISDGNEDTPITEDDEMPENEPVDSNCMSKCRLHNMPICISEFDGCYFSCKDEFVKPSMSRLSDAKMRSPANNRTKVWKEGDTEGLAAEMGRLNDFEKGIDDLNATEESTTKTERLKQQGEELKKKADEFRQRAETIKREAERHAANLKKERDEMWKTGKEEIEHAHEEGKEAISAAEAKVKELKERRKPRRGRWLASTI
ncbi:hypothetical protein BLNAU_7877 [Blattamonas nauphoetae]|uniref:Uncharacterized protein n=1 Tax=Blattamonas nauphoetae TaxID=2049346 RepID=A0ABQ9XZX0_9EUKA|nr:hypothetical protein BLNAU_7877 [Blattamonas nauphoetae]